MAQVKKVCSNLMPLICTHAFTFFCGDAFTCLLAVFSTMQQHEKLLESEYIA